MKQISKVKVMLVKQNKTENLLVETLRKNETTVFCWHTNEPQLSFKALVKRTSVLKGYVKDILVSTKK